MAQRPFILPSGVDFYAGDGTAAGVADPLLVVSDSTNKVGINSQTPSGTLDINTASATDKGLIIRSSTSQTANLLEVQNSSSGTIYYIDGNGNQSGISASYQSGIILSNGVPSSTTSALYANGATLYWNGALISTGTVANALTLGSGLSSSTATTFNGSAVVTANLGGTGTLSSLYYPVDIIIGNSGTAFAVANGSTNRIFIGQNAGYAMSGSATVTNNSSIVIGNVAGAQSTFTASDQHSVLIGYAAGSGVTNTYSNIYIGGNAGISSSGGSTSAFNVAVGYNALGNAIYTTLARNAALGLYAGASSNGRQAVYLGAYAGYFATGLSNSYVGYQSAYQAQGGNNAAIGFNAFQYGTGNYVTALGNSAGSLVSGDYNLYVGYFAGYKATGVNNIEILASGNNSSNSIIGSNSNKLNIGNVLSGDTSTKKLYIGSVSNSTLSPAATLQIQANAATDKALVVQSATSQSANILEVQNSSGTALNFINSLSEFHSYGNTGRTANQITFAIGNGAGRNIAGGDPWGTDYCTYVGTNAGLATSGASWGTYIGIGAGQYTVGYNTTAIGYAAGTNSSSSTRIARGDGVYIGYQAGYGAYDHNRSVVIGSSAGSSPASGGWQQNVLIGFMAGQGISGAFNTVIGSQIGVNLKGSYNVFVCAGSNYDYGFYTGGNYNCSIGGMINGDENTIFGINSVGGFGGGRQTGSGNTFIGRQVAAMASGNYNLIIGYNVDSCYDGGVGFSHGSGIRGQYNIDIAPANSYGNITNGNAGSAENQTNFNVSNKLNIARTIRGDISTKQVSIGNASLFPSGTLDVISNSATRKTVIIQGATSQSANLLELQNSSSGILNYIDANGNQSGISASYPSGITLTSGIPAVTTNKLYASGSTLFFNGLGVGTGVPSLAGGASGYLTIWSSASGISYNNSLKFDSPNNKLVFTGTGVGTSGIAMNILSDSTLSFEGTAGQLFSIADGMSSGTIFSVNDISGMSSIEVDASGLIKLGEYDGYVGIGTSQTYGQYTGKVEINAPSGYKGLIVRPASGSTSNIFEVQNSSSGAILAITASGAISGAITPTIITSTGNITLDNTYNGYIIEQTGVASSGTFTLGTGITIPGWNCSIVNIGSGVIVASGSNTMRSPGGLNKSRTQYSTISIYRRGTNDFVLGGDLA